MKTKEIDLVIKFLVVLTIIDLVLKKKLKPKPDESGNTTIKHLTDKMLELVEEEKYEAAAKIRDRIKAIKSNL